jgi:chorismate-pyruvate lyase
VLVLATSVIDAGRLAHTSKMLQQLDLSQRTLGQNLLAKNIRNLLDRNSFARLIVRGRAEGG